MKPYTEYKDSAVEWLGEIPKHWRIVKLKRISKIYNGSTPKSSVSEYWEGDINWVTPEDLGHLKNHTIYETRRKISEEGYLSCGTSLVPEGSLVLSTRAPIGHIAIAGTQLCGNQGCRLLTFDNNQSNKYFYYLLYVAKPALESLGQGSTFMELNRNKLEDFRIAEPTIEEQRAIASFLDREISRIDKLIEKKQKQIELLQEKRSALISHVVTKGLDPNVKMKDSGVEWLGEVPEHWELIRLKYCADLNMGQSPNSENVSLDKIGIPFLQGNADFGELHPLPKYYCNLPRKTAKQNDILISVRAPVGALNIADQNYCIGRGLCSLTFKSELIEKDYAWYLLQNVREQLAVESSGSTYDAVATEDVANIILTVPPSIEQQSITSFLNHEILQIDKLIQKIENSIEKLKEYRTSLISAAVTGKIDIRDKVSETYTDERVNKLAAESVEDYGN